MEYSVEKIKDIIKKNIGISCDVISKQGRRKKHFKNCILECAYPEIFTLKYIDHRLREKKIVFSYTDVLIKNVTFTKCKDENGEKGA